MKLSAAWIVFVLSTVLLASSQQLGEQGVIAGQLRDVNGAPAAKVRVSAQSVEAAAAGAQSLIGLAETDAEGRFRIENLPPGRYRVMAGLIEAPTYFPGTKAEAEARTVAVSAGATISNVNFAFVQPSGVRVTGRVTNLPSGLPPGSVHVALQQTRVLIQSGASIDAQSDGAFEFSRIPPGTYAPYVTILGRTMPDTAIKVEDRDIEGLQFALDPLILGRVEIEGGGRVPVSTQAAAYASTTGDVPAMIQFQVSQSKPGSSRNSFAERVFVRQDGLFLLPGVSGNLQLFVTALPAGYYVRSASYGGVDLLRSSFRAGSIPGEQVRVELTRMRPADAPPEFKVSGKLTGLSPGRPSSSRVMTMQMTAPSTNVTPSPAIQITAEVELRSDATFDLLHIPQGTWSVRIWDLYGGAVSGQQSIAVGDSDLANVELQAPEASSVVNTSTLSLAAMSAVAGGMIDVNGRYLLEGNENFPADLRRIQLSAQTRTSKRNSVPTGSVIVMQLPKGGYDLSVLNLPANYAVESIMYDGRDLRSEPLKVDGPLASDIVVKLSKFPPSGKFAKVSGRMMNLPAAPYIQDPMIILARDTKSGGGSLDAPVQADGTFAFNSVPPGSYTLSTWGLSSDFTRKMEVHDSDILDLTIPLPGLATPFILGESFVVFNSGSPITLRGVITQEITQLRAPAPPAYFRMEVPDANGQLESWAVMLSLPGVTRTMDSVPDIAKLKIGTRVIVLGDPRGDGSNRVSLIPRNGPSTSLGIELAP